MSYSNRVAKGLGYKSGYHKRGNGRFGKSSIAPWHLPSFRNWGSRSLGFGKWESSSPNAKYLTKCPQCGRVTSIAYVKKYGKCKPCNTGIAKKDTLYVCPDCGEKTLTSYQKNHHYHCDNCTRASDPIGYYNEITGRD